LGMMAGYLCPVCGYHDLYGPPWLNGSASDEICPSCDTHFGYEDAAGGDAARRESPSPAPGGLEGEGVSLVIAGHFATSVVGSLGAPEIS